MPSSKLLVLSLSWQIWATFQQGSSASTQDLLLNFAWLSLGSANLFGVPVCLMCSALLLTHSPSVSYPDFWSTLYSATFLPARRCGNRPYDWNQSSFRSYDCFPFPHGLSTTTSTLPCFLKEIHSPPYFQVCSAARFVTARRASCEIILWR